MRLMVVDTVGGDRFSSKYRDLFPNVKLRGLEKEDDGACHPHGYQVGYLAGCLLSLLPGEHELIFVRNFDGNAAPVEGVDDWLLDVIADERPDGINHSWGQWDQDTVSGDRWGKIAWESWARRYRELTGPLNIISFFAAGNNDSSAPRSPDLDPDVDYPQVLMPFIANVIGSHQQNGQPSYFSGDGPGVQCCFWADPVLAPDYSGSFSYTRGTSFASPKALAVWSYFVQRTEDWREFVKSNCSKPFGWSGAYPHPKWGFGSLEHKFQDAFRLLSPAVLPPAPRVRSYFNFQLEA